MNESKEGVRIGHPSIHGWQCAAPPQPHLHQPHVAASPPTGLLIRYGNAGRPEPPCRGVRGHERLGAKFELQSETHALRRAGVTSRTARGLRDERHHRSYARTSMPSRSTRSVSSNTFMNAWHAAINPKTGVLEAFFTETCARCPATLPRRCRLHPCPAPACRSRRTLGKSAAS